MSKMNLNNVVANGFLEDVFHSTYGSLCHYAFQLIGDADQAEDVVQDAFVLLWDNIENVSKEFITLKSYLYATVRNICYNRKRREKVIDLYLQRISHQEEFLYDQSVDHKLIYSEVLAEIDRAIKGLPEACQMVFRLGYLEGLKNHEIAEKLDVSINTVKTQKQRGLKILRRQLQPELFSLFLLLFYR